MFSAAISALARTSPAGGPRALAPALALAQAAPFPHARAERQYATSVYPPLSLSSVWPETFVNNDVVRSFQHALAEVSGGAWPLHVKYGVKKEIAFDEVRAGAISMTVGHSTYWPDTAPASAFFASIPFGLGPEEFAAWVSHGGGKELWREHYRPHNLVPFMAGDTGMQMGGWFNKRMRSTKDFAGVRMRIEGLGGPTLARCGLKVVDAPASKLATMLREGSLDACEFATPSMDLAAGLPTVALSEECPLIYHYPGWHQPSAVFEFLLNGDVHEQMSTQQRAMIRAAAREASESFTRSNLALNRGVLLEIINSGVIMHQFPLDLLLELKKLAEEEVCEHVHHHEFSREVHESYHRFMDTMIRWGPMSAHAMWQWRDVQPTSSHSRD